MSKCVFKPRYEFCADCIHHTVCMWQHYPQDQSEHCQFYKDKSLFVELPCKVGDKIYKPIITSRGKPAIWEIITTSMSIEIDNKNSVSPNSYVIGHLKNTLCGESADFCDFGKTVFLTKEDAEKKLKEIKDEKS